MTLLPSSEPVLDEFERRERLLEELLPVVDAEPASRVVERLQTLHPADQADFFEEIELEQALAIVELYDQESLAELLAFLNEATRTEILGALKPKVLSEVLLLVDEDLAADLVEDMPDDRVGQILSLLDSPTSSSITDILALPEDSVGRWMSRDILALQTTWTVGEAEDYLRRLSPDADHPFYLYTVDKEGVLCGAIDLRRLITADPKVKLQDIEVKGLISVDVNLDQEDAAQRLRHYGEPALPVVDGKGVLLGVLTADDVLDVQIEEATEDIYLQVGLDADAEALSSLGATLRLRAPWLLVNLTIGFFSAFLVSFFEETLAKVAILAAFMPVIAGHGGNTGCQTTTLVVRGLALGEIYKRDLGELVFKEVGFGLLYGTLAGLLTGGIAYVLSHNLWMSAIVMIAMTLNIACAGFAGSVIPMGLKALKVDPALASTVWLTTFTDWIGFLLLLGLGTLLISHL